MSYDIEVFSTDKPDLPAAKAGRGWQIAIDGPLDVEPEDIPADVRAALPNLRFLTQFHLEGDAPASAHKTLLTMARALARSARGLVVDPQEGTVETPRGVQRLEIEPERPAGSGLLELSWFIDDAGRLARAVPTTLLDALQATLPEALPRRYGLWEPPQFTLATHGIDHLRQFLGKHLGELIVWYCHKPCRRLAIKLPDRVGATPRGFRCGRLTLEIDGGTAGDRAWRDKLVRVWVTVADLLRPFYAEIRQGECPVKSWWWNGVPSSPPSALLIGSPYDALWPEFASTARLSTSGLHYREHFVELEPGDPAGPMASPPIGIAQPPEPIRQAVFDPSKPEDLAALHGSMFEVIAYPEVWPFEEPVAPSGSKAAERPHVPTPTEAPDGMNDHPQPAKTGGTYTLAAIGLNLLLLAMIAYGYSQSRDYKWAWVLVGLPIAYVTGVYIRHWLKGRQP